VGEDINDQDAIDNLYGRGNLSLDDEGKLRVPKPKALELEERDLQRMYRVRVLEGDLPLVPTAPIVWGRIVESCRLEVDGDL